MARLKTSGGLYLDRKGGKGQKPSFFPSAREGQTLISGLPLFLKGKMAVFQGKSVSSGAGLRADGRSKKASQGGLGRRKCRSFDPVFQYLEN
jgi:hypothetical protein